MLSKSQLKHIFAAHIASGRTALGLTQQELADLAHTSFRRIQKVESCAELPSFLLAVRLIILLGIDANAMIDSLAQEPIMDEQPILPDNVIPFPTSNNAPHIQNKH